MANVKYAAFVKVAELGNLTKAAEELGYSQPGISHMIKSLETEFGFSLFNRTRERVELTENGNAVLSICQQILRDEQLLQETVDALNGLMSGKIVIESIGTLLSDFVPRLLHDFSELYSEAKFEITSLSSEEIFDHLRTGNADVGFVSVNSSAPVDFYPLFKDEVLLLLPREHRLASFDTIPVEALVDERFIIPSNRSKENQTKSLFGEKDISIHSNFSVTSDDAAIGLVAQSIGLYLISSLRIKTSPLPDAVVAKHMQGEHFRSLGIAIREMYSASPAVKKFVRFAIDYAKKYKRICLL